MASPPWKFTSYDLDSSIEVARAIEDNGALLNTHELATRLGYKSANSGTFLTRLANARLFGLVDGRGAEMRASQRAINILRPDFPATAAKARLEAFEAVPLFKAGLDEYHGRMLPNAESLKNALTAMWEIEPERASFVLARLLESADQAGLFKTTGDRSRWFVPRCYSWLRRYEQGGLEDLADQSHRPRSSPLQMPAAVEATVLGLRRQHPS